MSATDVARSPSIPSVLRVPEFRVLLSGRVLAVGGSALSPVALAFAVLETTHSAASLGLVLLVRQLMQIAFSLLAGVVGDRLPRYRVLLTADTVAGLAQAVAAAALIRGDAGVALLAVTAGVNGAASAFVLPAVNGLVPQLVPPDHLQPANAVLRLSYNVCSVTGIALAGVVVSSAGAGVAVALDAATFFGSALLFSRLRGIRGSLSTGPSLWGELRTGWREFSGRQWLWVAVVQASLFNLAYVGALSVLGPLASLKALGGAIAWSIIAVGHNVGYIVGGLLASRLRVRRPLLAGLAMMALEVPFIASLGAVVGLDVNPVLGCSVVTLLAVLGGFGIEIFGVLWDSTIQSQVPQQAISRVSSYDQLASMSFVPLGLALMGPLAQSLGIEVAGTAAATTMAVSIAGAMLVPAVRRLTTRTRTSSQVPDPARGDATPCK